MTQVRELALVAIYSDVTAAAQNFNVIIELTNDPIDLAFDAAVAVKGDDGTVDIVCEHRTKARSPARRGVRHVGSAGVLSTVARGVNATSTLDQLLAGEPVGESVESRTAGEDRKAYKRTADDALDAGEALLTLVCSADEARRLDDLLSNARLVIRVDVNNRT